MIKLTKISLLLGLLIISLSVMSTINTTAAAEYTYNQSSTNHIEWPTQNARIDTMHSRYRSSQAAWETPEHSKQYTYQNYWSYGVEVHYGDTIKITLPSKEEKGGTIELFKYCEGDNEFIHFVNTTTKKIGKVSYTTYNFEVINKGYAHYDDDDGIYFEVYEKNGWDDDRHSPKLKLQLGYGFTLIP